MDDRAAAIEKFILTELTGGMDVGALDRDEDLLAADLIDSLGITELVGFLERSYGITVEDEDLVPENFSSVNSIVALASRKAG